MMQKPSKCCKRPGKYHIIYDCGGSSPDQEVILCNYHYNLDPAFQRNIKSIEEIKNA